MSRYGSAAPDAAREDRSRDSDVVPRADREATVLEAAQVMLSNGEQTGRVDSISERLAEDLDVPGQVQANWGHLDLIDVDHGVQSVEASPEAINLTRVQMVRDAVADNAKGKLDFGELSRRISAASSAPAVDPFLFAAAAGLGAAALVLVWGLDSPLSVLAVGITATVGAVMRRWVATLGVGQVAQTFGAALIGGLVGAAAPSLGLDDPEKLIAIGPALVLVPGPHLLNGGLDVSGGRLPLGICRLLYAFILIFAISAGTLLGLAADGTTLAVFSEPPTLPLGFDALCASIAAGCYAIFFSMPLRYLPIAMVVSGAVHALHSELIAVAGLNLALASGIGALVAGCVLIPVANRLRIPFAGIGFASVVALVPSVYVHRAVSGLVQVVGQPNGRVSTALLDHVVFDTMTAVLGLLALVVGLVLPFHAFRAIERWQRARA